jgi:transposase
MEPLYIGIDWSEAKHDVCFLNKQGAILQEFVIEQSAAGYAKLLQKIRQFQVEPAACFIAIETAYNLLLDFLLAHQYTVFVLPPNMVAGNRSRFGSSGRRNDQSDARLIADICRTDQQRLTPWQRDGRQINRMKALLRLIDDLTQSTTRYSNRLRSILLRAYPVAQDLFHDLTTQIGLQFLMAYPTQTEAQALSLAEFSHFCQQQRYSHPQRIAQRFAHLQQEPGVPDAAVQQAEEAAIVGLATCLLTFVQQKRQAIKQVQQLFTQHPDQAIFASVPGAGELLAPKLLVMFGTHRSRYARPADIQALAGTCPITVQSGKKKVVRFRRGCNYQFRHTAHSLAVTSVQQSTWAATYFQQARERGLAKSHAYRCLANRWLAIIWTLWQRNEPYDESYHMQQVQRQRRLTAS